MVKSKKNPNRSKPSLHLSPSHSYNARALSAINSPRDEDDDICPVCESECTCDKTTTPVNAIIQPPAPIPSTSSGVKHLKIKQSGSRTANTPVTIPDPANDSDNSSLSSVPPASPVPHPKSIPQASTAVSLPKKRGRPSKADLQAREAAARAAAAAHPDGLYVPYSAPPRRGKGTNRSKKPAMQRKSNASSIKARAPRSKKPRPDDSFAEPSRRAAYEYDDELSDASSVQFPTFLPASVLSGSGDSADSSSDSDSSIDDDISLPDDSSIQAEEEELILSEEKADRKARLRRELFGENIGSEGRRWDQMNWNKRERKTSIGPEGSDDISTSDSDDQGDENEEDEEGEAEDEPELDGYGGPVHDWSEQEEDYDAELFFANLSDSAFDSSTEDDDLRHPEKEGDVHSELDSLSLHEAAEASIVMLAEDTASQGPLVVMEDWDGQLVFGHGLKDGQGMLDIHFEASATVAHDDAEFSSSDDETEDESLEYDEESDGDGNTTAEEDLDQVMASTPLEHPPFRFPTPQPLPPSEQISSIVNSPAVSPGDLGPRTPLPLTLDPSTPQPPPAIPLPTTSTARDSPTPADILARRPSQASLPANLHSFHAPSGSVGSARSSDSRVSESGRSVPVMGSFMVISVDPKASAIIDGSREMVIPSPYALLKKRKSAWSARKRRASRFNDFSPHFSKRLRQTSIPGSSSSHRARRFSDASDASSSQSSPDLPPPEPVELDDLLDITFLGNQPDDGDDADAGVSTRHLRNLTRWDRVPMGTFRRSRTVGSFSAANSDQHPSDGLIVIGPSRTADGFSYGSTVSAAMRSPFASPSLGSMLWDRKDRKGKSREIDSPSGRGRSGKRKVVISPVIFPVGDDGTPTRASRTGRRNSPDERGTTSKRQKRVEDKKSTDLFDPALASPPLASPTVSSALPIPPPLSLDQ